MTSGFTDSGTGGDIMKVDLNKQFDKADMVWVGTAGVLVWIMIPGVGLLYSGLSRKKHALSLLWASLMAASLTAFQWFFWGYSLVFTHTSSSPFLGDLSNFALMKVFGAPGVISTVPDILFCFFQMQFACVTAILLIGGASERARLLPMMVFLFCYLTVVYCPIAYWIWGSNGWLYALGALDFAGGGPVHQNSGFAALAYALVLGKRHDPLTSGKVPKYKPHSVTSVVLGTVFLWFGWFGFNGGSTGNATIRSWYACVNTNIAAATGGLTWMFVDYFRTGGKLSVVGLCLGVVVGLVCITPAAGYVNVYTSILFGIVPGIICNFAVDLKEVLKIDDGLDVFATHGIGGALGSFMTGLFATDYITASDGSVAADASMAIDGGWMNHNYVQLGYQLAAICAVGLWSFCITALLLLIMDRIPWLRLRLHEDEELLGTDMAQIGELTFYDEDGVVVKDDDHNPYVLEPVRSTDARLAKLRNVTSKKEEPEVVDATNVDGTGSFSPEEGGSEHSKQDM